MKWLKRIGIAVAAAVPLVTVGWGAGFRAEAAPKAIWERRYDVPDVAYLQPAADAPGRYVISSNQSGNSQLYSFDSATERLTKLTDLPGRGILQGTVSPNASHVYYYNYHGGTPHIARVPFTGGEPENIAPTLDSFRSSGFDISRDGSRIGIVASVSR